MNTRDARDARDGPMAALITEYRKAHSCAYHEAARAVLFDDPWATRSAEILARPCGRTLPNVDQ